MRQLPHHHKQRGSLLTNPRLWDALLWGLLALLAITSLPVLMEMPARVMRRAYLLAFLVVPPTVTMVGVQMLLGKPRVKKAPLA